MVDHQPITSFRADDRAPRLLCLLQRVRERVRQPFLLFQQNRQQAAQEPAADTPIQ